MTTTPAKASYQVYARSTFMIGFTEITGLHYENESFETNEEAETWIYQKGKKHKEYTIIKTYKHLD
jgi:hypothetical protein